MVLKPMRVLLVAFESNNGKEDTTPEYFDTLNDVQFMNSEELMKSIKEAFAMYIDFKCNAAKDKDVTCKLMFIVPEDEHKSYYMWGVHGSEKSIIPMSLNSLSKVYICKADTGKIIRTYDGNEND